MNNYSNMDISQSSFNDYLNLYIRNFKYQYLKLSKIIYKPIILLKVHTIQMSATRLFTLIKRYIKRHLSILFCMNIGQYLIGQFT